MQCPLQLSRDEIDSFHKKCYRRTEDKVELILPVAWTNHFATPFLHTLVIQAMHLILTDNGCTSQSLSLQIKSKWKNSSPMRLQIKSKFMFYLCIYGSSQNGKKTHLCVYRASQNSCFTSAFTDKSNGKTPHLYVLIMPTASSAHSDLHTKAGRTICTEYTKMAQSVQSIQKESNPYRVGIPKEQAQRVVPRS